MLIVYAAIDIYSIGSISIVACSYIKYGLPIKLLLSVIWVQPAGYLRVCGLHSLSCNLQTANYCSSFTTSKFLFNGCYHSHLLIYAAFRITLLRYAINMQYWNSGLIHCYPKCVICNCISHILDNSVWDHCFNIAYLLHISAV